VTADSFFLVSSGSLERQVVVPVAGPVHLGGLDVVAGPLQGELGLLHVVGGAEILLEELLGDLERILRILELDLRLLDLELQLPLLRGDGGLLVFFELDPGDLEVELRLLDVGLVLADLDHLLGRRALELRLQLGDLVLVLLETVLRVFLVQLDEDLALLDRLALVDQLRDLPVRLADDLGGVLGFERSALRQDDLERLALDDVAPLAVVLRLGRGEQLELPGGTAPGRDDQNENDDEVLHSTNLPSLSTKSTPSASNRRRRAIS
jgi:hypothetical protein